MRRGFGVVAFYAAVTAALLFPVLLQFGSVFPHDAGDPILNSWILWHESRHVPLSAPWWNGPMFFPALDTIALSEVLLSLLPLSAMTQALTHNPVAAYNVVFVATFPLCALAMYLLAKDLTGRTDAALVAGLAFMLAPYRAEQLSHVQVLAYFWTPVVLLALHRYLGASEPPDDVGPSQPPARRGTGWLVLFGAAWLGQSLANGYAMFHVSVLVALWIVWFVRPIRRAIPIVVVWAIAALPMLPILLRYEAVHSALHLSRDINEVKRFGVDLADFLTAPADLVVWGGRLGLPRPETAVFPGVTVLVLAAIALLRTSRDREAVGSMTTERVRRWLVYASAIAALVAFSILAIGPWRVGPLSARDFHKPFSIAVAARLAAFLLGPWTRRMWRTRSLIGFYVLATALMYLLALGPEPRLLGRPMLYEPPYAWLMRLPGFDTLRVPARFVMLAVLCQSVLVALALARWGSGRRRTALVTVVAVAIAFDGWFKLPVAAAPGPGPALPDDVAAVVELPLGDPETDFAALYRSMIHERPTVNGFSGYLPPHYIPLERTLRGGRYEVLHEISPAAPIAVTVDRRRQGSQAVEARLVAGGMMPASSSGHWATFIVAPRARPAVDAAGMPIRVVSVTASRHPEDVGRMLDGDVATAWGTELGQTGGEELVVELEANEDVGSIVLDMGPYAFGFPAGLDVEVSVDRVNWSSAWHGDPGVLAVRGAILDPRAAPIRLDLGAARARFIRLRQTGEEPTIPWWIAEIAVYGR